MATGLLALLGALCLALAWWVSRSAPISAPESGPSAGDALDLVGDATPTPPTVRVAAPLPPAAAAPPGDALAAGPSGEESAGTASVTGRCLAAEDRRPIADCVVVIGDTGVEVARSAGDGTFVAEVALDSRGAVTLRFDAADRATRVGSFTGMKHGSREELGDLLLPRGWQVRGRVTEVDGTGVGGNNVIVFGVDTALRAGQVGQGVASAACADDGTFALDMLLPEGSYRARVTGLRKQRSDGAFVVDRWRGAEPRELLLLLEPAAPVIRGMVVDTQGRPIAQVGLRAEVGEVRAVTDIAGRFLLRAAGPAVGTTRVLLEHPDQWAPEFAAPLLPWGQQDARIVLPDGPRVAIEVVDEAGAPVTEYVVLLGPVENGHLSQSRAAGKQHSGGRCVLSTPRFGAHQLRVVPTAPDLLCSEVRRVELRSRAAHDERFVLERSAAAAVLVIDDAGEPVPGADLCLLRLGTDLEMARHNERDPRDLFMLATSDRVSEVVDRTKADAEGRASLRSPRLARGLGLRARAEGLQTNLIVEPQLSSGSALRVVLQRGGALRIKVELNGQAREQFAVAVSDAKGEAMRLIEKHLDVDGECLVPMLPPGRYSVSVRHQMVVKSAGTSMIAFAPFGAPVIAVDVVGGATATVTLAAPRVVFGSLAGRLVGPDALRSSSAALGVILVRLDASELRIGVFAVASDGSFRAEGLLPGRYRVAVQERGSDGLQSVLGLLEPMVSIEPGVAVTAEFAYVRRRLQLRLRWPDGQPVHGMVEQRSGSLRGVRSVAGELVLDPAPELPVEFRVGAGEWSAPVVMPQDRQDFAVDVVVPRAR